MQESVKVTFDAMRRTFSEHCALSLSIGCLLLLAACSGGESDAPATGSASTSEPRATGGGPPTSDGDGSPALFKGRIRSLPEWGDDLRRRIDPGADGWPTEVFAIEAERKLLEALTETLSGRAGFAATFGPMFAPDGKLSEWRPTVPTTLFEDGEYTVHAIEAPLDALHGVERLDELGAAWRADLDGLGEPRIKLEIDHLVKRGGGIIDTEMLVRVQAERDARLQQNIRWSVSWSRNGASIDSLRLLSFESIRTRHLPFRDVTVAVFGQEPCFARELAIGNEDYHQRQDRTCRRPFLGMHGIAVADVDGDGLEDIYVGQPGGQPNRLFLHQPDGTVRDGAAAAGIDLLDNAGPVLLVDLNNDGAPEALTAVVQNVVVGWNDGTGTFTRKTLWQGQGEPEISTLSAADADGDGDLDVFAGRYVKGGLSGGVPLPYFDAENGAVNLFWRNDGEAGFTEASAEVGLDHQASRFTLASLWDDFDDDGDQDLYVINDFGSNCLYRNDGGHFREMASAAGVRDTAAGMGAATGDIDLDGNLDLYVTNMSSSLGSRVTMQPRFQAATPEVRDEYMYHARGNTLLMGTGESTWVDISAETGVSPGDWAWGGNFLDWNNDGFEDIIVPNGFLSSRDKEKPDLWGYMWRCVAGGSPLSEPSSDYANAWDAINHFSSFEGYSYAGHERNFAYLNRGGRQFSDVSYATALDFLDDGRAAATLDWDGDGREDLLLRNRTGPRLRLVRNDHSGVGAFVSVELEGTTSNRDAVGARIFIEAGGRRLMRTVQAGEGYLCASSFRQHFGLHDAETIERMTVRWPNGGESSFENLAVNARYRVVEGADQVELVDMRSHPAMAEIPSQPLPVSNRPNDRIVVLDRLPLDPIRLPPLGKEAEGRTLGSYAGSALILAVGPFDRPAGRGMLRALAPVREQLAASKIEIVAISLTDADRFEASRDFAEGLGFATNRSPDPGFHSALEVVVIEILGAYPSLPLPLVFSVDAAGQLCVLYCGRVHPQQVIDDLVVVGPTLERLRGTEGLTGGRWAFRPSRSFDQMADVFEHLGRTDASSFYRTMAAARAGTTSPDPNEGR